jgi:cobalamin biosynthesis protein CbiG
VKKSARTLQQAAIKARLLRVSSALVAKAERVFEFRVEAFEAPEFSIDPFELPRFSFEAFKMPEFSYERFKMPVFEPIKFGK